MPDGRLPEKGRKRFANRETVRPLGPGLVGMLSGLIRPKGMTRRRGVIPVRRSHLAANIPAPAVRLLEGDRTGPLTLRLEDWAARTPER